MNVKRMIPIAVLLVTIVVLAIVGKGQLSKDVRDKLYDYRYVVHAGGALECGNETFSYTNSYEALENLYLYGNRISEFDFLYTSDGEIVCAHNGKETWAEGFSFREAPTLEEFLNARSFGSFTPMSLSMLAEYMEKHKDLYVVTDVKDDNIQFCQDVRNKHPKLLSQFIIQIYHEDEYEPIKRMGFKNIIYTLYRASDDELELENLEAFLNKHDLFGVTFWESWADETSEFYNMVLTTEVPIFVHTVNEKSEMEKMFNKGIVGIYTDVVDPLLRY